MGGGKILSLSDYRKRKNMTVDERIKEHLSHLNKYYLFLADFRSTNSQNFVSTKAGRSP